MRHRNLGDTGINVSLMSYGTGGPSRFGAEAGLSQAERSRLIGAALDLGVNLFDTAAGYGETEVWLGDALKQHPQHDAMIATKWSWRRGASDGELPDASELVASLDRSLDRLGRSHIDIMQIHGLNPTIYDSAVERYADTLIQFKESGKAKLVGFSEMMTEDATHSVPLRALELHADLWDTIMLKYGILNQYAAKQVLPLAAERGVGILNMAPVRMTLTREDHYRQQLDEWRQTGEIDVDHPKLANGLDWLIGGDVDSVVSAGYKFAADNPAISTVICGTANIDHLIQNAAALQNPKLPPEHHDTLRELLGNSASTH